MAMVILLLRLFSVSATLVVVAAAAESTTTTATTNDVVLFDGCDMDDYYDNSIITKNITIEDRNELHRLIQSTHRRILPYTDSDGGDDVWKALQSLDVGFETKDTTTTVDNDNASSSTTTTATSSYTIVPNTVRLIYAQRNVPFQPHGTCTTWNREHLFPKSKGVGSNGPDYTDIHHLRPADWNINSARSNKYFGVCSNSGDNDDNDNNNNDPSDVGDHGCTIPAHPEAHATTQTNANVWTPPVSVRGDIARALLYMELRYDGDDDDTIDPVDLILTDCPNDYDDENLSSTSSSSSVGVMAYKSILLKWHVEDPPDDIERRRNDLACQRWQGNRNPFVDFPYLAELFYGPPVPNVLASSNGNSKLECSSSSSSTPSPLSPSSTTPSPMPNDNMDDDSMTNCTTMSTETTSSSSSSSSSNPTCSINNNDDTNNDSNNEDTCRGLNSGDIMVVGIHSDNPDTVVFVALVDIRPGTQLFLTDNAYIGDGRDRRHYRHRHRRRRIENEYLRSNEGTVSFLVPDDGILAGTVFGYGNDDVTYGSEWKTVQGSFSLSTNGDTVILYCYNDDENDNDDDNQDGNDAGDTVVVENEMNSDTASMVPSSQSSQKIRFLTALSFSGAWQDNGSEESLYGTASSGLPDVLTENQAVVTLDHQDNYMYIGPTSGTYQTLKNAIRNPSYWVGSNTQRFDITSSNINKQFNVIQVESTEKEDTPSSSSSSATGYLCRRRPQQYIIMMILHIIGAFLLLDVLVSLAFRGGPF